VERHYPERESDRAASLARVKFVMSLTLLLQAQAECRRAFRRGSAVAYCALEADLRRAGRRGMRLVSALVCALSLVSIAVTPAQAENRVRSFIGNNPYADMASDEQLRNAVNDARVVGEAFRRMRLDVVDGENLSRRLVATVGRDQSPADYDETIGDPVYLTGLPVSDSAVPNVNPAETTGPCWPAEAHWKNAKAMATLTAVEDHKQRFGACAFASLTAARIEVLKQMQVAADSPEENLWNGIHKSELGRALTDCGRLKVLEEFLKRFPRGRHTAEAIAEIRELQTLQKVVGFSC